MPHPLISCYLVKLLVPSINYNKLNFWLNEFHWNPQMTEAVVKIIASSSEIDANVQLLKATPYNLMNIEKLAMCLQEYLHLPC